MRRMVDLFFALPCFILALPLLMIIAIAIKVESPGAIFYRQKMVGWNGRIFSLYRFRTMYGTSTKAEAESGFTRVGRFVRDFSLDHLPQLINLLMGDITLIGPRPMEVQVVDLRESVWKKYVQVKPGLFNYAIYKLGKQWAPSRSSHPDLNQELELQYEKQRSINSDVQLFLGFLQKFVSSKGNIKARGDVDPELEQRIKDGSL